MTLDAARRPLLLAAVLAAAAPSLLAYNLSPSPTFLNQALALAAWGLFIALAGGRLRDAAPAWPLLAALGAMAAGVLWSWGPGVLPSSLALSALGLLLAAAALAASGAAVRACAHGNIVLVLFCAGWVVAGGLNTGLAVVQVFAPDWPDGAWIAQAGFPGRAVGNLRQPNHLSSLLLWSAIASVALLEAGRLRQRAAALLLAAFVFAVVLTASRTGLVSVLLLACWGAADRTLSRPARRMLLAAPLVYAVAWWGMSLWAQGGEHQFGGQARLAETDISSSRFGIWANVLTLIQRQPWTGVGFGELNFAWSLTPFPGRPTAFFDHAHNLPLQLAVELGLPLAAVVLAFLIWALWRGVRGGGDGAVGARCAWVMVLMIGVHSLLEYPLWYAYFLLPAAWALGYAMGRPAPAAAREAWNWPVVAGVVLLLGSAVATADYLRVTRIFEAAADAPPLEVRVAEGRRSVLFSHHADYAAATTGLPQPDGMAVFDGATHYLLDTRLMVAWAAALERAGRHDAAAAIADRLREFGAARAETFFDACQDAASAAAAFQCHPAARTPGWRDFARP
jgi:O-antigen ligase